MSGTGTMRRQLPDLTLPYATDPPIAAWLHQGAFSRATVAVTFPGTHKAMSLTRGQATKLRKALEAAEAILVADDPREANRSIDLMKRISP